MRHPIAGPSALCQHGLGSEGTKAVTRITDWIVRHPTLALGLALLITTSLGAGLPDLGFDTSNRGLMAKGDPAVAFYENVIATFGEDSILTVVIKSDDIFQEDILQSIQRLTRAGGAIEGVTRVVSLTTVSNLESRDGTLYTDDLLLTIPSDPAELAAVRESALKNDLLLGEVVSRDGKTSAVHLFLETLEAGETFEGNLIAQVEALIEQETKALGGRAEMYQIGTPFLRQQVRGSLRRDLLTLSPLSLATLFVTLFFFFRTPISALPALTGTLSVIATLGFMGLFGFGITTVSAMVPLLLLVVGSAEDIHMLAEYQSGLREQQGRDHAVKDMAHKSRLAILLTSFTTLIGFITMVWNPLPELAEFGIACSFGIGINFLLTILVVPSVLQWLPPPKAMLRPEKEYLVGLQRFVLRMLDRRRLVVTVAALVIAACVVGIFMMEVDTDFLRFLPEDSEVQVRFRDISKNLVGGMALMVVVDTHRPDGVKDPAVLQDVAKLSDFMSQRWDKVIGYADFIRKLNMEVNDGDPAFRVIPDDPEAVAQYSLLLDPDDISRFVDFDFTRTILFVRGQGRGSGELRRELAAIEEFVESNLSRKLTVTVTGEAMLIYQASDTISRNLLTSLAWVLVPIFICISLLFSSWKAGALAMIPNVLPVVVGFGVMGFTGIPLSIATFPVEVIALGIAVDDTIHFMTRFSQEIKLTSDNREAISRTMRAELQPVLTTSVALVIGFSMLCFGEFASTKQFGFLAALTMAVAWVSDLMITPMLLYSTPLITAWDLLRLKIGDQVVERSPLFRGLKASEVKRVALLGTVTHHRAGEHLLRQGDEDDYMLVLLSGGALIQAADAASGRTRDIANVEPGDVVGEVAFFTKTRRTASVISTQDGEVLRIDAPRMRRVAARFPKIAAKVYANLGQLLGAKVERTTLQIFEAAS
jgi:predicted RND superfamily exporter protein